MQLLTYYTSYDEVRAALGVSSTELTDLRLALPIYAVQLEYDLEAINPLVITQFQRIHDIDPPSGRTTLEAKFFATARLFSAYAVAKHLLVSLPMFSVEKLEDGKAGFTRFNDAYQDMRDGVDAMYVNLMYRLGLLLQELEGTPVEVPAYGATITSVTSPLSVDPVTDAT